MLTDESDTSIGSQKSKPKKRGRGRPRKVTTQTNVKKGNKPKKRRSRSVADAKDDDQQTANRKKPKVMSSDEVSDTNYDPTSSSGREKQKKREVPMKKQKSKQKLVLGEKVFVKIGKYGLHVANLVVDREPFFDENDNTKKRFVKWPFIDQVEAVPLDAIEKLMPGNTCTTSDNNEASVPTCQQALKESEKKRKQGKPITEVLQFFSSDDEGEMNNLMPR